jgi:methionine synthase I (cobalamin-dependent)
MLSSSLPIEFFRQARRIVVDGAHGTELRKRGIVADCLESANLSQPELVTALVREYVDAGAELVRTNTFQANAIALGAHGLERDTTRINQAAVRLCREGAAGRAHVVGSIGPVGFRLRTPGTDPGRARDAYTEQALALEAGGAGALLLETLIDPEEVRLALDALSRAVTIPIGVCMTFGVAAGESLAGGGATPERLLRLAEDHGATFVGANCGRGLEGMDTLATSLSKSRLPVWLSPSAGFAGSGQAFASAEAFAELGERAWSLGVAFYGGCCGTDPSFIRALSARRSLSTDNGGNGTT